MLVLPITARMSTQGSMSDPVSPVGSKYVSGIGWTLGTPAGSGRTGAGQSSFRLAALHPADPPDRPAAVARWAPVWVWAAA